MTRKLALALGTALALAASPSAARADGYLDEWHPYQTYWAIAWQAAMPVFSLRSGWVDAPSWTGGQAAVQVGVVRHLALGVAVDWSWFDATTPFAIVQRSDATISGPSYRRVSMFTALGTARWYPFQGAVQPWVGAGVGAVWFDTRLQSVDVKQSTYGSALAVVPEVGLLFSLQQRFGLYVSGSYHWTGASLYAVKDAQWVAAQVGVAFYF